MNRILIPLIALAFFTSVAFAQTCLPDNSVTQPGIYPNQLDTAIADKPYKSVIQILAIRDTTVNVSGQVINATIDSIKVTSIQNLPDGFDFICEPINCLFTPDQVGCIKLTGNPTNKQVGEHLLTIKTTLYAKVGILDIPYDQDISTFKIVIKRDGTTSINNLQEYGLTLYPNPSFSGIFKINEKLNEKDVAVYSMSGTRIVVPISSTAQQTGIDLSDQSRGIYFLRVKGSSGVLTTKLVY